MKCSLSQSHNLWCKGNYSYRFPHDAYHPDINCLILFYFFNCFYFWWYIIIYVSFLFANNTFWFVMPFLSVMMYQFIWKVSIWITFLFLFAVMLWIWSEIVTGHVNILPARPVVLSTLTQIVERVNLTIYTALKNSLNALKEITALDENSPAN